MTPAILISTQRNPGTTLILLANDADEQETREGEWAWGNKTKKAQT